MCLPQKLLNLKLSLNTFSYTRWKFVGDSNAFEKFVINILIICSLRCHRFKNSFMHKHSRCTLSKCKMYRAVNGKRKWIFYPTFSTIFKVCILFLTASLMSRSKKIKLRWSISSNWVIQLRAIVTFCVWSNPSIKMSRGWLPIIIFIINY